MTVDHNDALLDADDALLDALGRGLDPDPDDSAAGLLAVWHAEISRPLPAPSPDLVAAVRPRTTRRRWFTRPVALAVGMSLLAFGGATAMAAAASPGSLLWPITRVVFPAKAESRAAEQSATHLLDQAATAIAERRYPDALTALGAAERQLDQVTDVGVRKRLEDRWVALRAQLLAATAEQPGTRTPVPSPSPGAARTPSPGATRTPSPAPGSASPTGLLPLPPISSILPSLPLVGG